jgi:hypothetical protein
MTSVTLWTWASRSIGIEHGVVPAPAPALRSATVQSQKSHERLKVDALGPPVGLNDAEHGGPIGRRVGQEAIPENAKTQAKDTVQEIPFLLDTYTDGEESGSKSNSFP